MSNKPLRISEEAAVQMPMKTVASLIALVAIGTWAFFGIQEKLNSNSTKLELMQKDLIENTSISGIACSSIFVYADNTKNVLLKYNEVKNEIANYLI